ncbi:MAG: MerR family transcriptional regulator [Candidatus Omnitrophica bacterium]|nr:MerR family transcriptional regulator [Candidatus Omnitrophota bacterium]
MGDIYLIKDLARSSGFSIYTIKYYLNIDLIKESGRFPETNFRYFDNTTLEQLKKIHQLRKEKKSIKQIKKILIEGV